jgi:hypothetical protein
MSGSPAHSDDTAARAAGRGKRAAVVLVVTYVALAALAWLVADDVERTR